MVQRVQSLRTSIKNTRPAAGTREPGEIYVSFPDLQLGVINASKAAQDLIAVRFFSAATNYAEGDFVIQAGRGYRAKGPIVSGAFNAADWETLSIIGESEPPIAAGTTADYWRGDKSWQALNKAAVGLSNVDNTSDANKPVSSAQQTALNLKANLVSPTFTGTPAAPTPAYPNSSTALATTAFVSANFAPVMDPFLGGNPQATTPPISDNDSSIATTAYVKANLVNYAPIDSPIFTGDPRAPTPLQGDNDTSLATTAFVTTAVANKVTDAPNDTNAYGRKANSWVDVTEEAPADGVSYGRKNGNWVASVGGAVVSDTPPPGPLIVGQLWYEADSGNTYLWYSDADSSQWVQVNVQPAPVTSSSATGTAQTRNRIVNGAMQVSQENGDVVTANGAAGTYYPADQWIWTWSLTGTANCLRSRFADSGSDFIAMNVVTATASPAAGAYCQVEQYLEGYKLKDALWGTINAKQMILRFGFRSFLGGTFTVAVRNAAADRVFLAPFTSVANTWQTFTIVVPGETSGTWPTGSAKALIVAFGFVTGTTFGGGTAGWGTANKIQIAGNTNGAATAPNYFHIADVGLYLDPLNTGIAPPWVMPDEAEELRACQRYWHKTTIMFSGNGVAAAGYHGLGPYKVTPRIAPSLTGVNVAASGFAATVGTLSNAYDGIADEVRVISGTTNGAIFITLVTVNARM